MSEIKSEVRVPQTQGLVRLGIKNYRSIESASLALGPINVFFGPNGVGKTSVLDAIWFFRDCAIRGVESASTFRSHGIGLRSDWAGDSEDIAITLETETRKYQLSFSIQDARISGGPGEELSNLSSDSILFSRATGELSAVMESALVGNRLTVPLREPEKPSLGLYLDLNRGDDETISLDRLLHYVRLWQTRSFNLYQLKVRGSDNGPEVRLFDRGENLWTVLRNVESRRHRDRRYDTIMSYMSRAFPGFESVVLESTGPDTNYANFLETGLRTELRASGVSDGHLQLLLLLAALFAEGDLWPAVLMFDEPETSLHPWGQLVFAEAVREAATKWKKQVFIATHSPILLNLFHPAEIISVERDFRTISGASPSLSGEATRVSAARFRRLSEIDEIRALLESYGAGHLYMSQLIGEQSTEPMAEVIDSDE